MRACLKRSWVVVVLAVMAVGVVRAQAPVTAADITRLETSVAEIERMVPPLRSTDPTLAGQIEKTLVELKDEVTYLKVKQRRERRGHARGVCERPRSSRDAADEGGRVAAGVNAAGAR